LIHPLIIKITFLSTVVNWHKIIFLVYLIELGVVDNNFVWLFKIEFYWHKIRSG